MFVFIKPDLRSLRPLAFGIILLLALTVGNIFAKDKRGEAEAMLAKASEATDIWSLGQPWQLNGDIRFLQMKSGEMNGSVSILWAPPDRWREQITAPGYSETFVRIGEKSWRVASLDETPIRISEFNWSLQALSRRHKKGPFPGWLAIEGDYKIETRKVNGADADCVEIKGKPQTEFDCIAKDSGLPIAISDDRGTYEYSDYKPWQGKMFPGTVRTIEDSGLVVEAHISLLTLQVQDIAFAVPVGASELSAKEIRVPDNGVKGRLISKKQPIYPPVAKVNHQQGTVIFWVIIGKDGRIKFLHVVQSAGSDLNAAAFDAVREWVYKPLLLDGKPVEVETYITVNFNLRY